MKTRIAKIALAAAAALTAAACADGSTGLSTSALAPGANTATVNTAAKTDPACIALTARIDALRKEGVVERVEKAAAGKTKTVSVKRESLVKLAELDKANAEFQAKCALPLTTAARPAAPAAAPVATAAPAATVPAKTAAATAPQPVAKP